MVSFRIREFIISRPESLIEDPDGAAVAACHLVAPRGTEMHYLKVMPPDAHVVSVHLQGSSQHCFGTAGKVLHDGPISAGTVAFMPSGEHIDSVVSDGFDVLEIFIPCWWLDSVAQRTLGRLGRDIVPRYAADIRHDPMLHHLACAILDCLHMPDQNLRVLQFNALSEAFASRVVISHLSDRDYGPTISGGISAADLVRIRRHIDQSLGEPLTIEGLAEMAGLSQFHFARAFKASTGEAPYRFIQQRRMQRAHDLLRSTNLPIGDIAAAVGYDDPGHFAKIFRRVYGTSPRMRRRESCAQ